MKVLVFAPHADDEVLGVGGTIAKRAAAGDEVYVCVVTRGAAPLYSEERTKEVQRECREADSVLGVRETIFLNFPAVMLETVPRYELNGKIAEVVQRVQPDEVYLPHRGDMQLDHKMIVDACRIPCRASWRRCRFLRSRSARFRRLAPSVRWRRSHDTGVRLSTAWRPRPFP